MIIKIPCKKNIKKKIIPKKKNPIIKIINIKIENKIIVIKNLKKHVFKIILNIKV
jgi:hypothetical protein